MGSGPQVQVQVLTGGCVPVADCLFKVCPMSRYSAQKQYWKAKQAKHEKDKISDVVLLQKLQVRQEVEPSTGSDRLDQQTGKLFSSDSLLAARVQPGAETERDGKQESPRRCGQIWNRHTGIRVQNMS